MFQEYNKLEAELALKSLDRIANTSPWLYGMQLRNLPCSPEGYSLKKMYWAIFFDRHFWWITIPLISVFNIIVWIFSDMIIESRFAWLTKGMLLYSFAYLIICGMIKSSLSQRAAELYRNFYLFNRCMVNVSNRAGFSPSTFSDAHGFSEALSDRFDQNLKNLSVLEQLALYLPPVFIAKKTLLKENAEELRETTSLVGELMVYIGNSRVFPMQFFKNAMRVFNTRKTSPLQIDLTVGASGDNGKSHAAFTALKNLNPSKGNTLLYSATALGDGTVVRLIPTLEDKGATPEPLSILITIRTGHSLEYNHLTNLFRTVGWKEIKSTIPQRQDSIFEDPTSPGGIKIRITTCDFIKHEVEQQYYSND